MPDKRTYLPNPDSPKDGNFVLSVYDDTHPLSGFQQDINIARNWLRGFTRKRVRIIAKFRHFDPITKEVEYTTGRRTLVLKSYRDVFGPGGVYLSLTKDAIPAIDSTFQINLVSMTIQEI